MTLKILIHLYLIALIAPQLNHQVLYDNMYLTIFDRCEKFNQKLKLVTEAGVYHRSFLVLHLC